MEALGDNVADFFINGTLIQYFQQIFRDEKASLIKGKFQ